MRFAAQDARRHGQRQAYHLLLDGLEIAVALAGKIFDKFGRLPAVAIGLRCCGWSECLAFGAAALFVAAFPAGFERLARFLGEPLLEVRAGDAPARSDCTVC